jgi:hypothetical protein
MYSVPQELLQPGKPYPDLLRYLAMNGYCGQGEVEAHVAKRVESLRNPSGMSFRGSHARWAVVSRSASPGGGRWRRDG